MARLDASESTPKDEIAAIVLNLDNLVQNNMNKIHTGVEIEPLMHTVLDIISQFNDAGRE